MARAAQWLAGAGRRRARTRLAAAGLLLLTAAGAVAPRVAYADFQGHPDHFLGYKWAWTPAAPGSRVPLHLAYERDCAGQWFSAADAAGWAWQGTPTPLFFDPVAATSGCSTSPIQGRTRVVAVNAGGEFVGRTPAYTRKYKTIKVCDDAFAAGDGLARSAAGAALSPGPICHLVTQSWLEQLPTGSPGQIDAVVVMMNTDLFNNVHHDNTSFGGMAPDDNTKAAVVHELGHALGLAHAGFYASPPELVPPYSIMDDTTSVTFKFSAPQPYDVHEVNTLYPGW